MGVILGDCVEALRELGDDSIDSVVTDPPYGIGFMGKAWDGKAIEEAAKREREGGRVLPPRLTGDLDRPEGRKLTARTASAFANRAGEAGAYDFTLSGTRAFQAWCEQWGAELLRVLKPGGHALVFGGCRTHHRLTTALEEVGFEIRDELAWLFGSGFPKSLDVSKAIDKQDARVQRFERAQEFQAWLREHLTPQRVNELTESDMGHHLTTHPTQPAVATAAMFDLLRPHLPSVPESIEELVRMRTVESENYKLRQVVGKRDGSTAPGFAGEQHRGGEPTTWDVTIAHTPEAERWQGWGTALKPAHEPIVVARKPFNGTVAANVLEHGTGALNVDGCRIAGEKGDGNWGGQGDVDPGYSGGLSSIPTDENAAGRWPANVVLDEAAAAMLDEQSGESLSSGRSAGTPESTGIYGGGMPRGDGRETGFGDRGGASRFFYCAKTSRAERNAGLDGFDAKGLNWSSGEQNPGSFQGEGTDRSARNHHPTVKPITLMRWLVRLVTPPGGTVLDPFLGSGTTGIAAALEGFEFVGIEREADYLAIAEARIAFWREHGEDGLKIARESSRRERRESGQLDLLA